MNNQELVNKIDQLPSHLIDKKVVISKDSVLDLVNRLSDCQKVKIPQFMAELIKELKSSEYTITEICSIIYDDEEQEWIDNHKELFYRAWLDGYEVDAAKYQVRSGNGYFSGWEEVEARIVLADIVGFEEYVKYFDNKEDAERVASVLGWEVEEVEEMEC